MTDPVTDPMTDPWIAVLAALERVTTTGDRLLLATDFDGVLAPLVLDPMSSRPTAGSMAALAQLATRPEVSVALVSGRDAATLRALTGLGPDAPVTVVGSHGAEVEAAPGEPWTTAGPGLDPRRADLLAQVTAELADVTTSHEGARLETKPVAVALHTRGLDASVAAAAEAAAEQVGRRHRGVTVKRGKAVVELAVVGADKGTTVLALADALGAGAGRAAVVYLGDDVTDEDVFTRLEDGDVGIKVGPGATAARWHLSDPETVAAFLTRLSAYGRRP